MLEVVTLSWLFTCASSSIDIYNLRMHKSRFSGQGQGVRAVDEILSESHSLTRHSLHLCNSRCIFHKLFLGYENYRMKYYEMSGRFSIQIWY